MNFLVDANVFLDYALKRARFEASRFFSSVPTRCLSITQFSVHPIGMCVAAKRPNLFHALLEEFFDDAIRVYQLSVNELRQVTDRMASLRLDFDAFNYVVAEKFDLHIVSFDTDFDRTPRGRILPAHAVELFQQQSRA